jgi:Tfp pilus assembly protein PilV
MDVWGKQSNPSAAQRAQDLLERVQANHDATGDVALQPNVISYNTVTNTWAKAGANVEGAECSHHHPTNHRHRHNCHIHHHRRYLLYLNSE